MSDTQDIRDDGSLKKYRTELPNIYDDDVPDPYEFRVLAHYKRVGRCTESTTTTSKKCGMSRPQLIKTRDKLAADGWIALEKHDLGKGQFSYIVTIKDKWPENFERYSHLSPHLQGVSPALHKEEETLNPHSSCQPHDTPPKPSDTPILDDVVGVLSRELQVVKNDFVSPLEYSLLRDDIQTYGAQAVSEAIKLMGKNGGKNYKYASKILVSGGVTAPVAPPAVTPMAFVPLGQPVKPIGYINGK